MKLTPLTPEFTFAGFTWPRYVARMACGYAALKKKAETRKVCGEYYHAPKPSAAGKGFYLDSDGQPFTRWEWCDNVCRSINHTGWFADEFQDTKIRGIVARLTQGRYLAGWSMGEGMASAIEYRIFDDIEEAARYADSLAESVAESERERLEEETEEEGV